MASAPEPAAAHSKCAMPNGVPYWLSPPISIIGLLTWPTKASSTKPRAMKPRDSSRWNTP